jgi:hypothetical protein
MVSLENLAIAEGLLYHELAEALNLSRGYSDRNRRNP